MYNPPHFREENVERLQKLVTSHPLATLVTLGANGFSANHIPLLLYPEPGTFGTLRGHVSRANSLWRDIEKDPTALAIFQGADAYITPSWYPTKQETGRVVPTWNYAVVHAHGKIRTFDQPDLLLAHVRALVEFQEGPRAEPWHVDDAPADYISGQLKGIVGIEIPIDRLEGKWKVSQNRSAEDQAGVVDGLRASGSQADREMAQLVAERARQK